MHHPESQVRRIKEHIQEPKVVLSTANLHDAVSSTRKVGQVVFGIKERNRVCRPARSTREEDRAELRLETGFHMFLSRNQRARDRRRAAGQGLWIGND